MFRGLRNQTVRRQERQPTDQESTGQSAFRAVPPMAPRKQKHWNILAAISILLAALLAVSGISDLDVGKVPNP